MDKYKLLVKLIKLADASKIDYLKFEDIEIKKSIFSNKESKVKQQLVKTSQDDLKASEEEDLYWSSN